MKYIILLQLILFEQIKLEYNSNFFLILFRAQNLSIKVKIISWFYFWGILNSITNYWVMKIESFIILLKNLI